MHGPTGDGVQPVGPGEGPLDRSGRVERVGTGGRGPSGPIVALIGVIAVATFVMEAITDSTFDQVLFEVISAFATVGLSTGITPDLPAAGEMTLMVLMFVGRVGTITVASALALKSRHRHFHLPEERPVIG